MELDPTRPDVTTRTKVIKRAHRESKRQITAGVLTAQAKEEGVLEEFVLEESMVLDTNAAAERCLPKKQMRKYCSVVSWSLEIFKAGVSMDGVRKFTEG